MASLVGRQCEPPEEALNVGETLSQLLRFFFGAVYDKNNCEPPARNTISTRQTMTSSGKRTCLQQWMGHVTPRSYANFWCAASGGSTGERPTRTRFDPKPVRLAPSCWVVVCHLTGFNSTCFAGAWAMWLPWCRGGGVRWVIRRSLSIAWRKSRNHPSVPHAKLSSRVVMLWSCLWVCSGCCCCQNSVWKSYSCF